MMLPTHALAGMLLALPVALVAPAYAPVALGAGLLGGVLPDLDMYVGHRRTLHYPVYLPALGSLAAVVAVLVPTPVTVAVALVLLGAAVHSVADVFGGGLELRPWEATSHRAVYDHHNDRWIVPRRWVRYDGSPADLALSVCLAVPLLAALDGAFAWIVAALLAVGAVYTAVRRHLPTVAETLVDGRPARHLPAPLLAHVPRRYTESGSDGAAVAVDREGAPAEGR